MKAYINPIAIGIMVSLCIIYLAFVPVIIYQYRNYGNLRIRRNVVIASFIVYMITAWFMTILPLPSMESVRNMDPIQPNFRPFLFIKTFLNSTGFAFTKPSTWVAAIKSASFFTVAFNVVLTIPFGIYLKKYFKIKLPLVVILGFLLSAFYELTQYTGLYGVYPQAYRFADVDDLMVNTLGAVIGYFLESIIGRHLPNPAKDNTIITEKATVLRRLLSFLLDSIIISVLFELSRVAIYWNHQNRKWDVSILMVSEIVVFLLIPLLMKKKQTIGMLLMKLSFVDKKGQCAKVSRVFLHNLLIGMLPHFTFGIRGMIINQTIVISFQLLFIISLFIMLYRTMFQKKGCYYWEPLLDIYLKADLNLKNL